METITNSMIDHTSPVGEISSLSGKIYKTGCVNFKEDLINGVRSGERSWKKYNVRVKGYHMELFKMGKATDPIDKEEAVLNIPLESCFVISDKVYKDGSRKILVLRTPDKHQYLINPVEEDNVSWTVSIEDAIDAIHQEKVARMKKQLDAAKKWLVKIEGEGFLPKDLLQVIMISHLIRQRSESRMKLPI